MENEPRITPAVLKALVVGDLENALIAATPGGIEAQEARGQVDFVASTTLPIEINRGTREQFEQMGIVFGEPVDDLFCGVQLPEGWHKKPTEHSMWSNLLDDKGRKRASIFYKAAFYDRSAHISIERRYGCNKEPVGGWDDPDYGSARWHAVVTDCNVQIWATDSIDPEPSYPSRDAGDFEETRQAWLDWCDRREALCGVAKDWLQEHYPDWQDPTAYWD